MGNWPRRVCRLGGPVVCCWQRWSPRGADGISSSPNASRLVPKKSRCFSLNLKAGKGWCPGQQAEGVPSYLQEGQAFYSVQVFSRLNEAHPHCRGPSFSFRLPIQMLISSESTLRDTPKRTFNPMSRHPCGPVKLTRELSHLKACTLFYFILFYFILAVLGLHCCTRAFSSCSEQGLLFFPVHGLLIAVASLVAEHGL